MYWLQKILDPADEIKRLTRLAEETINTRPGSLVLDIAQLKTRQAFSGTAVLTLQNLLNDGIHIHVLFGEQEAIWAADLEKAFKLLNLDEAGTPSLGQRGRLVFSPRGENLKNIAVDLTGGNLGAISLKLQIPAAAVRNFDAQDYEITTLNGFLIWLHLSRRYPVEHFDYELAALLFKKLVGFEHYGHFLKLKVNQRLSLEQLAEKIEQYYEFVAEHATQKILADLHNHPTSCVRADFIISQMQAHPELNFSDLNQNPKISKRLKQLGYDSLEAISRAGDVTAMHQLIATPLEGSGSLAEYLLRYKIIKSVLLQNRDYLKVTHDLAQESYARGVRYLELRFGLLRQSANYLSDEDIRQWRMLPEGENKTKRLTELLKQTEFFQSILSYFEGLRQFGQDHLEFSFGMLVIVDKGMSPELFRFLAEQIVGFKQGRGFYADQNLLQILMELDDFDFYQQLPREKLRARLAGARNSLTGFDTAGNEYRLDDQGRVVWRYNAALHEPVMRYLQNTHLFTQFTSHAGESWASLEDGLEAIEKALEHLKVKRIGHALALGVSVEKLLWQLDRYGEPYTPERIHTLKLRQRQLLLRMKKRGVAVESNFSSNLQTGNVVNGFKHPSHRLFLQGIPILMGTDGTSMNNTSVAKEVAYMRIALGMPPDVIDQILKTTLSFSDQRDNTAAPSFQAYEFRDDRFLFGDVISLQLQAMAQSSLEAMVACYEQALESVIEALSEQLEIRLLLQQSLILMALGFLKKSPMQIQAARKKFIKWASFENLDFKPEIFEEFQEDFVRMLRKVLMLRKKWPELKIMEWINKALEHESAGDWELAWGEYLKAAFHESDPDLAGVIWLEYIPRTLKQAQHPGSRPKAQFPD